MRKRERENPCHICGHYHKYEEGEVCKLCGHQKAQLDSPARSSAFPDEILPNFLFLGSYDNATRLVILKQFGILNILNVVPACQNFYKNVFNYHHINDDGPLPFDECFEFIESVRLKEQKVLVHCMTGLSKSPAVVVAYLMKSQGWSLEKSYQWVKERRPRVEINQNLLSQLNDYEKKVSLTKANSTSIVTDVSDFTVLAQDLAAAAEKAIKHSLRRNGQ